MRTFVTALLVGSGLLGASAASAQSWYPSFGRQAPAYPDAGYGSADEVCSGQRAQTLEQWLDRKAEEGRIDPDRADGIHSAIDRLEHSASITVAHGMEL